MPAALALVLLLSACGEPEISLEELRQQAEDGVCVLSVDADVEAGRDTWMRFYEATQAEEYAEVTLVSWYSGDPFGVSRQDRFYTYHLSFTDGVYTLTAEGRRARRCRSSMRTCSALKKNRMWIPGPGIRR